jgi:hypothetical protein
VGIVIDDGKQHAPTCFVHDDGPCDCGVEEYMTDEDIDAELFAKAMAKE